MKNVRAFSKVAVQEGLRPRAAVLFVGDQLPDTLPSDILELQDPQAQLALLRERFPNNTHHFVVFPSVLEREAFAVYDQFLQATTPTGEPMMGYPSTPLKALPELNRILEEGCELGAPIVGDAGSGTAPLDVDLVAFSKGGVVLNQFFAEMSGLAAANAQGSGGTGEEQISASDLASVEAAHKMVRSMHYVDCALNARGAFIVHPRMINAFAAKTAATQSADFRITLTGTWTRWDDPQRPWVKEEFQKFVHFLKTAKPAPIPVASRLIQPADMGVSGLAARDPVDGIRAHMKSQVFFKPDLGETP